MNKINLMHKCNFILPKIYTDTYIHMTVFSYIENYILHFDWLIGDKIFNE